MADRFPDRFPSSYPWWDNDVAAFFGLTTVSLPLRDLGLQATQHLRAIVADPRTEACTILLATSLTVRKTRGSPPAD